MQRNLIKLAGVSLLVIAGIPLGCESDPPRRIAPPEPIVEVPVQVNPDGSGDFPTIQAAIDSAEAGDVIELSDGVFRGDGNRDIDFRGRSVTVRSQSGDPSACIIDCEADTLNPHRGFYFHSEEEEEACVKGVTITGGYARGLETGSCGGAVLCVGTASPTFESCWFLRNYGGGMGGAAQCGAPGGSDGDCHPSFRSCLFAGNTASGGGAIAAWAAGPRIENCTITRNRAFFTYGGAIDYYSILRLHISNTIIAFNLSSCAVNIAASGNISVMCSDIFGNQGGDWTEALEEYRHAYGNISADPLFLDAEAGDFRLSPGSPCCPDSSDCGLMGALPAECP
jgi:hypothetical protein